MLFFETNKKKIIKLAALKKNHINEKSPEED
jgi:hypothetical protein